jgi:cytochrome c oxidase subunit 1
VTDVQPRIIASSSPPYPARRAQRGSRLLHTLRTTDPKDIGIHYLVTAFAFFFVGGAMALLIRAGRGAAGAAVPVQ